MTNNEQTPPSTSQQTDNATTTAALQAALQNLLPADRPGEVDRVAHKLPPFLPNDPELWFAQVELGFEAANITKKETKFRKVASALDSKYAVEVRDIIMGPSQDYAHLKDELIKRLSTSQRKKTNVMLENQTMGDRKPSQFLRYLKNLAGNTASDEMIRALWLKGLPGELQMLLASQEKNPLEEVAILADGILDMQPLSSRIFNAAPMSINEAAAAPHTTAYATPYAQTRPQPNSLVDLFRQTLEPLTQQIAALSTRVSRQEHQQSNNSGGHGRSRGRSRSRGRQNTTPSGNNNKPEDDGVCWYHRRHGDNAEKCTRPCAYDQGNGNGPH